MLTLDDVNVTVGKAMNVTAWTVSLAGGLTVAVDVQDDMVDAATANLNRGSGPAKIEVYTAAFSTLLVTFTAADPATGASSSGVATALGVPFGALGVAVGTAAKCRVIDSSDVMLWEDDVQVAP